MIPFNKPCIIGDELSYITEVFSGQKMSGDGPFSKKVQAWFDSRFANSKSLLTTSCSSSLDMAAILLNIQPGDEVIMPSYTFVSTANAFVSRGASIRFIDISPKTMNLDASLIEKAITDRTRAIVPVHYAGVSCEMDLICEIASNKGLAVVEDAAQGVMAKYKDQYLGTIGNLGCFSFHETKNYTSGGEGGLLIISDPDLFERAEIIREKGTNRSLFFRGMVDKYTWVDQGSSFLPSELNAAALLSQLKNADLINQRRLKIWNCYFSELKCLEGQIELPFIPSYCEHNAHMFYLKLATYDERSSFIEYMKRNDVVTPFHYVPLHSSPAGMKYGVFVGEDKYTTKESERLVRLPLYYNMNDDDCYKVIDLVLKYFR